MTTSLRGIGWSGGRGPSSGVDVMTGWKEMVLGVLILLLGARGWGYGGLVLGLQVLVRTLGMTSAVLAKSV